MVLTMKIQNLQQKNGMLLTVCQKAIESSLCDYSDAYILVTGIITVTGGNANTKVVFENCAPFKNCRIEINNTFVDYADFSTM